MPALPPPVWHPVLVHAPIVLLPLAALLATLAAAVRGWRAWAMPAMGVVLALAVAGAGLAYLTGDDAQHHAGDLLRQRAGAGAANATAAAPPANGTFGGRERFRFGPASADLETHKTLAGATLYLSLGLGALGLWQRNRLAAGAWLWLWPLLLWVAAAAVLATGWYGGALVYEHGIGVPAPA